MSIAAPRCPQCGADTPAHARFCPQCGARIAADPSGAAARAGERRQVAILFADLSGYTRLSSTIDPEETHRLLTRFFEVADAVIVRLGGSIDKHIGDAVMGVFGAPIAYGNDVERALRAALDIHAATMSLSTATGIPQATHIGIASGEVVAAATGSAEHRSYTVTGDAVNLAARLTDLARRGETVISDDVYGAAALLAEAEPLGSVALRGIDATTRAWKLVGMRAPLHVGQPLLGRTRERARFGALLACAESKRIGATVLLCADPGMGKTRLAEALRVDAGVARAVCHAATVLDFGAGQGRDAVYALVCSLVGVPVDADPAARRDALDRAAASMRIDGEDEPALADLLLVAQREESLFDAMDTAARRSAQLVAIGRTIERAASRQTCVVLVEDIHWASEWVLDCLDAIATTTERHPVLLTLTTRSDGDPIGARWAAERIERFDLAPLDDADALALARAHFASSPDLAQRCVERAQGNPLFLMQLLRSGTEDDTVPASIQSVVLARLDRLPPRDKAATQAAAVIGQRFPIALLRRLVRDDDYVPTLPVDRDLMRAEHGDGGFLMFTHALIRDGAYASLLHSARRDLHREAARWYQERDRTLYAEHLDRAEDPGAAEAYLDAARADAAHHVESALALTQRGGALPAQDRTRAALATLEGELLLELGRPAPAIEAFERARELASTDAERCAAWIGIASAHRMRSNVAPGLAALNEAMALAVRAGLARERARIHQLRGNLHFVGADIERCRDEHERSLALAKEVADAEREAEALSGLADALYAQGRLASAHAAFIRCIDICNREGLVRFTIRNRCMVGIIDCHLGHVDEALNGLRHAEKLARDLHARLPEAMALESAGLVLVIGDRLAEARELLPRALVAAQEIGARRFEAIVSYCLARVLWYDGLKDDARRHALDAWRISEEVGVRFSGPVALGGLAITAQSIDERRQRLAEGERLLAQGCLSHCHFGFYRDAIDAALASRDWSEAERYAGLLEAYTAREPMRMIDFQIARGRALAAVGRGAADRAALEACRREAIALSLARATAELDVALAHA